MHYTGQRMFGMVLHYLTLSIHLTIKSTLFGSVQLFRDMWRLITASPSMYLLGNLHDLSMQMNTVHVALTTLCIAMKTVLVNWKNEKSQHIRSAWGQVGVSLRLWFGVYTGDHGWNQCLNEQTPLWTLFSVPTPRPHPCVRVVRMYMMSTEKEDLPYTSVTHLHPQGPACVVGEGKQLGTGRKGPGGPKTNPSTFVRSPHLESGLFS